MNTISELRVLVFSFADLKNALVQSAEKLGIKVPDQIIDDVQGLGKEECREAIITFKSPSGIKEDILCIAAYELTECLIELCIKRKIPIPKKATKKLDVTCKSISLWIEISASEEVTKPKYFESLK